jgi:hypothetical protein
MPWISISTSLQLAQFLGCTDHSDEHHGYKRKALIYKKELEVPLSLLY